MNRVRRPCGRQQAADGSGAARPVYASRNTIRDALKWLLNRGLVETRHGQGTFVASSLQPFITTLSPDWRMGGSGPGGGEGAAARAEVTAGTGHHAARYRLLASAGRLARWPPAGLAATQATSPAIRNCHRRPPVVPATSHYPMRLVQRGATRVLHAADIDEGALKYLEQALGLTQVG